MCVPAAGSLDSFLSEYRDSLLLTTDRHGYAAVTLILRNRAGRSTETLISPRVARALAHALIQAADDVMARRLAGIEVAE